MRDGRPTANTTVGRATARRDGQHVRLATLTIKAKKFVSAAGRHHERASAATSATPKTDRSSVIFVYRIRQNSPPF
jgi:hypothetical protein